jgi:hypothetical protein
VTISDHAKSQPASKPVDTPVGPYRPAKHTSHAVDPADVLVYPTCAALHDVQAPSAVAPNALEYLPAAQSSHEVAPSELE